MRLDDLGRELDRAPTSVYEGIAAGIITEPVRLSARAIRWPQYEIEILKQALVAGLSVDQRRELVALLHRARVEVLPEVEVRDTGIAFIKDCAAKNAATAQKRAA